MKSIVKADSRKDFGCGHYLGGISSYLSLRPTKPANDLSQLGSICYHVFAIVDFDKQHYLGQSHT